MSITIFGRQRTVSEIALATLRHSGRAFGSVAAIVPKVVFGNSIGAKYNIAPRVDLWKKRHAFKDSLEVDSRAAAAASDLSVKGVSIFRHEGSSANLHAIQRRLDAIYADDNLSINSPNGTQRRVITPLESLPELALIFPDRIGDAIRAYYKCGFKVFSVQVWRNMPVPGGRDANDRLDFMSNTLHTDYWAVTSLRVFVVLSDTVTRKSGAFRYHDKKTTKTIFRSLKYLDRFLMPKSHREALYDPSKLNYFEGQLGDACVVNTQEVLHGSSIPEEGTYRDVVQYLIVPDDASAVRGADLFAATPGDHEMQDLLRKTGRLRTS